jgi:hypothetical protein
VWAYDFVFDRTGDGRQLKFLTVVDVTCPPGMFPIPELGFGTHKGVSMSRKRYSAEQIRSST